jgi:hypothetical protein
MEILEQGRQLEAQVAAVSITPIYQAQQLLKETLVAQLVLEMLAVTGITP